MQELSTFRALNTTRNQIRACRIKFNLFPNFLSLDVSPSNFLSQLGVGFNGWKRWAWIPCYFFFSFTFRYNCNACHTHVTTRSYTWPLILVVSHSRIFILLLMLRIWHLFLRCLSPITSLFMHTNWHLMPIQWIYNDIFQNLLKTHCNFSKLQISPYIAPNSFHFSDLIILFIFWHNRNKY